MAKVKKRQNPKTKKLCLSLTQAIMTENTNEASRLLKKLVKTNIARKLQKIEKETDLF
jgi:hypothetical protein